MGTGVGHRGPEQTFVELNLALLPEEAAGYLTLLFGPDALTDGGTLEQILAASADHAAELGKRLRERVYFRAGPTLAKAVAARMVDPSNLGEEELQAAYERKRALEGGWARPFGRGCLPSAPPSPKLSPGRRAKNRADGSRWR